MLAALHFHLRHLQHYFLLHIALWLAYAFLNVMLMQVQGSPVHALDLLIYYLSLALVFYTNALLIFPRLLFKSRFPKVLLLIPALYLLYMAFFFINYLSSFTFRHFTMPGEPPATLSSSFIVHCLWVFVQYSLYAAGYWYAIQLLFQLHEKQQLEQVQRQLEHSRQQAEQDFLRTEISFLKMQFNPHFVYNTLNAFYAQTLPLNETLAENIARLSGILSYSLQKTPTDQVPLSHELACLFDYIELQQMRFQQGLFLTFSLNHVAIENFQKEAIFRQFPDLDTYPVIPTLLITLLENAFKHGDYSQAAYPIVLDFDCSPQKLTFQISNHKRQFVRDMSVKEIVTKDRASRDIWSREPKVSTGIGLENTRKRLEHTYPGRHLFEITEDEHTFSLHLTLFNHS